jgi:hypothetical protein
VQCSELSEWPCQDAWDILGHAVGTLLMTPRTILHMYINYFPYEVKDFQLVKILPQHRNGIWLKIKLNVTFVRGANIEIYLKIIKAR